MQQPSKQQLMLHLLEDAWVYVHLDPRRDGVVLPDHLRQEKRLVLQYGYNMPVPIADFRVDDRGIGATLSFRRVPHATFIPWEAVFAVTDGEKRTWVWEEDMPADLNLDSASGSPPSAPPAQPAGAMAARERTIPFGRKAGPRAVGPAEAPPEPPADQGGAAAPEPPPAEAEAPRAAASASAPAAGKPGKRPRPSYLKLVD